MLKSKRLIIKILTFFRLFPCISYTRTPFKIYEYLELLKGVIISKDDVILDIGCGLGLQTMLLGMKCKKVYGIDISQEAIDETKFISNLLRKRINSEICCVKLENAKFGNETFDKIFSFSVIEHIPNYVEVLKEAYRTLKHNGMMIFSVDSLRNIPDELLEKHKKQYFVQKYFDKNELQLILSEIGFRSNDCYYIFRSNYAKDLFIKGLNINFRFGFLYSIIACSILKIKELRCNADSGIFLVVKCIK
ncbi:MAG: class I SAM-dependent methyltransferase [Candidatus Firestonebacteria bacterium]